MKIYRSLLLLFCISISLLQGQTSTTTQKFSYAYGLKTAILWKEANIPERERNIERFILGIQEGLKGDVPRFKRAQEGCDKRWADNTVWVADFPYRHGIVSLTVLATKVNIPVHIFDFHALREGYAYGRRKKKIKQTKEALEAIINQQFQPYQEQYNRRIAGIEGTIKKGEKFLKENAKKEEIITLASGLQYEVVAEGTGANLQAKDKFRVFYKTTFIDGQELEYLYSSDKPLMFQFQEKPHHAWIREAYPLLKKGSKYRFFVPHELSFGRMDTKKIPGGSALIHEIEVLEIFPHDQPQEVVKDLATISYVYGIRTAEMLEVLQIPQEQLKVEELIEGLQQNLLGVSAAQYQLAKEHQANYVRYKQLNPNRNLSFDIGITLLPTNEKTKKYPVDLFHLEQFKKGFLAVWAGNRNTWTTSEMDNMIAQYLQTYEEIIVQKAQEKDLFALQEGKAFLEKNAKKRGIISLPSGLQYEILKEGIGAKPTATDRIKVHYHGTLIDGTVFDSSVEREKPVVLSLHQLILGWQEGLLWMKEGGKYRLFIPQELAYGKQGHSTIIPARATLIFEIELIKVNPLN
ncbi:MAG: FKBP-type peptidyl-prolyl cis-trans isomerase [Aureispira sp.]